MMRKVSSVKGSVANPGSTSDPANFLHLKSSRERCGRNVYFPLHQVSWRSPTGNRTDFGREVTPPPQHAGKRRPLGDQVKWRTMDSTEDR